MTIAESIREARLQKKLTQNELGQRIGYSRVLVNRVEQGAEIPTYELTLALAQALDLSHEELWQQVGEAHRESMRQQMQRQLLALQLRLEMLEVPAQDNNEMMTLIRTIGKQLEQGKLTVENLRALSEGRNPFSSDKLE